MTTIKINKPIAPKVPFQNKQPTMTYNLGYTDQAGTVNSQTTFHSQDIKPDHMATTDPFTYVEALYDALDEVLNGEQWRDEMDEAFPCEVRPYGSQPTSPQIALMQDRSMTFDPRQAYDGRSVDKGEAIAGSLIAMEAPDVGALVSGRVSILDHTIQFGFTERSIDQTARKLLGDLGKV